MSRDLFVYRLETFHTKRLSGLLDESVSRDYDAISMKEVGNKCIFVMHESHVDIVSFSSPVSTMHVMSMFAG